MLLGANKTDSHTAVIGNKVRAMNTCAVGTNTTITNLLLFLLHLALISHLAQLCTVCSVVLRGRPPQAPLRGGTPTPPSGVRFRKFDTMQDSHLHKTSSPLHNNTKGGVKSHQFVNNKANARSPLNQPTQRTFLLVSIHYINCKQYHHVLYRF
jgi:hypothetical protein